MSINQATFWIHPFEIRLNQAKFQMRSLPKNLLAILWYSNLLSERQSAEVVRGIECRREGRQAIQYVHSVPVHSECDVGDELPIKGVREREREGSDMGLAAKREREKEGGASSLSLDRPHSLPLSILLLFLAVVE